VARSGIATARLGLVALVGIAGLVACRRPEPAEWRKARAEKESLQRELVGFAELQGKADRGQLLTPDQIAIGVDERVVRDLMNASLPLTVDLAGRIVLRIDSAEPRFRGNQADLVFRGRVAPKDLPNAFVAAELDGSLDQVDLREGRVAARVVLRHVTVLGNVAGDLGKDVIEGLLRDNLETLQARIPPLEIPVRLDEVIEIPGGGDGPVTTIPGRLPLHASVAQVVPLGQRLWVLLDATAGPWEPPPAPEAAR
jgi:hypothetical protein